MKDMVTIPREEYERLLEAAEDLADVLAYDMKEQSEGWRMLIEGVSSGASGGGSKE